MTMERRQTIKLTTIIGIAAFVFSSLGTLATQSFLAGRYAETIDKNLIDMKVIVQEFKEHKVYDDATYLKKEVFEESVKRRDEMFDLIFKELEKISNKIDRIR